MEGISQESATLGSMGHDVLKMIAANLPLQSKVSLGCTSRGFLDFWQNSACSAADYGSTVPHRCVGDAPSARDWYELVREAVHSDIQPRDHLEGPTGALCGEAINKAKLQRYLDERPTPPGAPRLRFRERHIAYGAASRTLIGYARLNNGSEWKPWHWPDIVASLSAQGRRPEAQTWSEKLAHYQKLQQALVDRDFGRADVLLAEKLGPIWLADLFSVLMISARAGSATEVALWIAANLQSSAKQQDLNCLWQMVDMSASTYEAKTVLLHAMDEIPAEIFRSLLCEELAEGVFEHLVADHPNITLRHVESIHQQKSIWPDRMRLSERSSQTQRHLQALSVLYRRGLLPLSGIDGTQPG